MDVWNILRVIVNNDNGDYHLYINGQYINTFNNSAHNGGKVGFTYYDETLTGSGAVDYVKISNVNKSVLDGIKIKRNATSIKGISPSKK